MTLVTAFFTFLICVQPVKALRCPSAVPCTCKNKRASCNGNHMKSKLSYIPKFPDGIETVDFTNNDLPILERKTLGNLSDLHITSLSLIRNDINILEKETFSDMKNLNILDLSRNNISCLDASLSFYNLPDTIMILKLNHMSWEPCENMFKGLHRKHVSRIELSHSKLTPFNGSWFENLHDLKSLDISWNSIKDTNYNFTGLQNLQLLNLAGNWFNNIPDFCREGVEKLQSLTMTDTKLYTLNALKNSSKCLKKLKNLYLCGISIRIIPSNIFSSLQSLKILTMNKMSTQLRRIQDHALNSSTLTALTFSRANGFWFGEKMAAKGMFYPKTLFKNCPQLESLDLSHNFIEFTSKDIMNMFNPLKKLKRLWLESLGLAYMPKDLLSRFPLLSQISFESNFINPWEDGLVVFGRNSSLKNINLMRNKINKIYKSSFPPLLLENVNKIDLSHNRFTCSCEIQWFSKILKQSKKFEKKQYMRCDDGMTLVLDYSPSFIECHVLGISTSIGCIVTVIVVSGLTIYLCRWRIRYTLYQIRTMREGYERLNGNDFKYSAYVMYTEEDLPWVKKNLIPELEHERGFKLCIPHRDFELGKVLSDNIVEHMHSSQTILPILSNCFAKDEWCLFQLAVARNRLTKQGDLSIFPIMLEEIEFKYMNAAMYYTIKMSNYAAWSDDESGRTLFWEQIRGHFQTCIR